MVRVRKLVLAIAAASALSSGMAHALGVGELTLKSSLNQPLVAEIELQDVRDMSAEEVRALLASQEEFSKAGVDRQYFLTDLTFTPIVKANGKSVIRVTSSKPVREPYLNFLVEVLWPNGRLLREYTLLLDPPLYSPQAAAAPQMPVAAPAPAARASAPAAAPRAAAPVSAAPAAAGAGAAASAQGSEYRTNKNDTLWEVAQRARGNGSVHQAMLAIQDLNPNAFIDGNINRMKSGQVLRLPNEQQVNQRTAAEALAQVNQQNSNWRQSRGEAVAARQIDATRRATAGAAPAEVQQQDNLKLLAAEAGQATAGSDSGASNSKALRDELAITQESLDSTRRENAELKDRMGDLQSQLDKLQRLMQLKDDQLAKLQASLSAPTDQAAGGAATPPAAAEPGAQAPAEQSPAPVSGEPLAQAAPGTDGEQSVAPFDQAAEAPADAAAPSTTDAPVAPEAQAPVAESAPVTESAPAASEPQPTAPVAEVPVEPQSEDSFLDNLLANPMLLGLIGGSALLALLLVLLILSRRRARQEAEEQEYLDVQRDDDSHQFDNDMELPPEALDASLAAPVAPIQPAVEERVTAQTGDALGEADIYIAYGRFNQAAELLHNAINDEPHRADLRLKLMEVYAELGDRDGFARQESDLREIGGAQAEVEQLKSRYPSMVVLGGAAVLGASVASNELDSFSLDDLTLDDPVQPAAQAPADDAFDLDLDGLDSDLDRDLQNSGTVENELAQFDELQLDSDLDLQAPTLSESSRVDDLSFDLDDDLVSKPEQPSGLADFSLDLDEPAAQPASEEDEFLLSLDDEVKGDDLAALPAEEAAQDDFELPADFDLALGDDEPQPASPASFAAQLDEVTAELDQLAETLEQQAEPETPQADTMALDDDEDFDFLSGTDETATKLDLARAYIDMGDTEGARDILDEVVAEGNDGQQQEARELISKLV